MKPPASVPPEKTDEEKVAGAKAYVARSLKQRRRKRDRPARWVLEGLQLIIDGRAS